MHHFLHLIKQLLSHYWLVFTLVEFTAITKETVVERIGEDKCDFIPVESLASTSY